jgi:hypothetical protein
VYRAFFGDPLDDFFRMVSFVVVSKGRVAKREWITAMGEGNGVPPWLCRKWCAHRLQRAAAAGGFYVCGDSLWLLRVRVVLCESTAPWFGLAVCWVTPVSPGVEAIAKILSHAVPGRA